MTMTSRIRTGGQSTSVESGDEFIQPAIYQSFLTQSPLTSVLPASSSLGNFDKISSEILLPCERYAGNIEYKWRLCGISDSRLKQLTSQMNYRLTEGNGECIYEIGVLDDGQLEGLCESDLQDSVECIRQMAEMLGAVASVLQFATGKNGKVAEILVRSVVEMSLKGVRIAVVGDLSCGKSTLVGVLSGQKLDDGRGRARQSVFVHRHELLSGLTSAISYQTIGFAEDGSLINDYVPLNSFENPSFSKTIRNAKTTVTFLDMAGHSSYLRTTISGLLSGSIDYVLLVVCAVTGLTSVGLEYLQLARALNFPVLICLSKIDKLNQTDYENSIKELKLTLDRECICAESIVITDRDKAKKCNNFMLNSPPLIPIVPLSLVGGSGVDILQHVLSSLEMRNDWNSQHSMARIFSIAKVFDVIDVGTVVSGTVISGLIESSEFIESHSRRLPLLLGPFKDESFLPVYVRSVHVNRCAAAKVGAGQTATIALSTVKGNQIDSIEQDIPAASLRRGMYLIDPSLQPNSILSFEAVIEFLDSSTRINPPYQPVIHMHNVRQSATLVSISPHTSQSIFAVFRFCFYSEFVRIGDKFVFRDGRMKGVGIVTKLLQI